MPISRPLKVLVVHCTYLLRGGEDAVVEAEIKMLEEHGHEVQVYARNNDETQQKPKWSVALESAWSTQTTRELKTLCQAFQPDIIHVHNTHLMVSPSVFWAANSLGIPVVQTVHNYRAACLGATFLYEGRVCEDCLGKAPIKGVIRGCFRDSPVQSAVLATSIMLHRGIGTYQNKVSRFIALTENSRQKLIEAGLPAAKIRIKPNFVEWSKPPAQGPRQGGLFVGRLSVEKGIEVLLDAVARLGSDQGELTIMGTGPLQQNVADVLQGRYLGFQALEAVQQAMEKALFMVMPSIWYEGFPRTLVEAFACGLPVIASRMGAMAEVIDDQQTGLLFEPGNAQEFAEKIRWALQHPQEMQAMGQRARKVFESRYDKETNHTLLTGIYREAIEEAAVSPAKASARAS